MKHLISILIASAFIGFMGCEQSNVNDEVKSSEGESFSGSYLNMESYYSKDEQLIFFCDDNDTIRYMVRIQGGSISLPDNSKGKTNGPTNDYLTISFSNSNCAFISIDSSINPTCSLSIYPTIGYGYAPLSSYDIEINELPSSINDIDIYISDRISESTSVGSPGTGDDGEYVCIDGGVGSISCTSGISGCSTNCTDEFWACCNLRCKCYLREDF